MEEHAKIPIPAAIGTNSCYQIWRIPLVHNRNIGISYQILYAIAFQIVSAPANAGVAMGKFLDEPRPMRLLQVTSAP